jgi:glutaredoxin 2
MSEQNKQEVAEQETDSQTPDSLSEDTSTTEETETIDTSELDGEESDSTLDIDKELSKETPKDNKDDSVAQVQRQKQVDAWMTRFNNGEVKKSDMPKWIQKEIDYAESEPDLNALIDKKVAEKLSITQDSSKYSELSERLKTTKMSASQKEKLLTRFSGLRQKTSKGEALEIAIEAAGIKLDSGVKRPKGMSKIKLSGEKTKAPISKDASYKEIHKNYSEDERRKHLIAQLNQD